MTYGTVNRARTIGGRLRWFGDQGPKRKPFRAGQRVEYVRYGVREVATVQSAGGGIVFLDNGRWMHAESCTVARKSPRVLP